MKNKKIKQLVVNAMFIALLVVSSFISIPINQVPITLQTLLVYIIILAFDFKNSIIIFVIYLIMGLIGLPIFSNFSSMEELESEVIIAIYNIYLEFLKKEADSEQYPKYKAYGMAYIRFAKEEKELFKLLFMRDRSKEDISPSWDFKASVQMIIDANSTISREKAELMHLEMWTCVHGIATMIATSFVPLEWEFISEIMSDVYHGIKARHIDSEVR